MKYKNKTISLSNLVLGMQGPVEPLCNSCSTKDCEHNIEYKDISIAGINKTWRLLNKGSSYGMVVNCEGYSS